MTEKLILRNLCEIIIEKLNLNIRFQKSSTKSILLMMRGLMTI